MTKEGWVFFVCNCLTETDDELFQAPSKFLHRHSSQDEQCLIHLLSHTKFSPLRIAHPRHNMISKIILLHSLMVRPGTYRISAWQTSIQSQRITVSLKCSQFSDTSKFYKGTNYHDFAHCLIILLRQRTSNLNIN